MPDLKNPERCVACEKPLKDGEPCFWDLSGGFVHEACCGAERESFVNQNGEPLGAQAKPEHRDELSNPPARRERG